MFPICPIHGKALEEAKEIAIQKLIKKGFDPEYVRDSIARCDKKAVRKMLRKLTRKELLNLFREDEK